MAANTKRDRSENDSRACATHETAALSTFNVLPTALPPFSFPEPTICLVSGGIVGLWYQPLPDVVKFTTSGSACLIR